MTIKTSKTVALIVAAGEGSRMGGDPKQYQLLKGKPLLAHSLETLLAHPGIDFVRVVIHASHQPRYDACRFSHPKLLPPVIGGSSRQESVYKGLRSVRSLNAEQVVIHDAARPGVTAAIIDALLGSFARYQAVVPLLPVADTLKIISNGRMQTPDRNQYHRAQTPQGFVFPVILALHEKYRARVATDDVTLAEWEGIEIGLVEGDERNRKITTAYDLELAEAL